MTALRLLLIGRFPGFALQTCTLPPPGAAAPTRRPATTPCSTRQRPSRLSVLTATVPACGVAGARFLAREISSIDLKDGRIWRNGQYMDSLDPLVGAGIDHSRSRPVLRKPCQPLQKLFKSLQNASERLPNTLKMMKDHAKKKNAPPMVCARLL